MLVRDSPSGRASLVLLSGELDIAHADRLRQVMLRVCVDRELVLADLHDVTFLDSTIIGVLVAAGKRCAQSGGRFFLSRVRGEPLRTLGLVGLNGMLLPEGSAPEGLEDELRSLFEAPST